MLPDYAECLPPSAVEKLKKVSKKTWVSKKIPDEWRNAMTLPLHKKGSSTDPLSCRSISLLRIWYKIMKGTTTDRLLSHKERTMRRKLYGLRPRRSMTDQVHVVKQMTANRNSYQQPAYVASFDFAVRLIRLIRSSFMTHCEKSGFAANTSD